jgi:hypothetical protein
MTSLLSKKHSCTEISAVKVSRYLWLVRGKKMRDETLEGEKE